MTTPSEGGPLHLKPGALRRWWRETLETRKDVGEDWRWWHAIPYVWLFTPEWWRYILGKRARDTGLLRAAVCRWRGHPAGVWWFNNYGDSPDMHCKNCGDDLG